MRIEISDEMIQVVAGLLRRLDHEQLEVVQFGEVNGHEASNFFERLEEALHNKTRNPEKIMSNFTYKVRANALQHEWIVDHDGDICLRPMIFDNNGVREVRYRPDPSEFEAAPVAIARLQVMEGRRTQEMRSSKPFEFRF